MRLTKRVKEAAGLEPDTIIDMIAWLQAKLASIPEDSREGAELFIDTEGGYDLWICYERAETEAERESARAQRLSELTLARDRLVMLLQEFPELRGEVNRSDINTTTK